MIKIIKVLEDLYINTEFHKWWEIKYKIETMSWFKKCKISRAAN
jgi:hypothetical protein